jgi:hypothetical protein
MNESREETVIRQALRRSIALAGFIGAVAVITFLWTNRLEQQPVIPEHEASGPQAKKAEKVVVPTLEFTDITRESGIDFIHETGAYGERLLPETMGGGVAFLDYDNDGNQDLLLINSTHWPWQPKPSEPATTKLYRGNGDATFEDVSGTSGLDIAAYGMGAAVGDFDADGYVDIFITALGENRLLRNVAGRYFEDVTFDSGVSGDKSAWSTSAAFLDYDNDGDLDLFVCNYVNWSRQLDLDVNYQLTGVGKAYGPPTDFAGTNAYLYRNDGFSFTDVSQTAGIEVASGTGGAPIGKGLAVHPLDVNGDGWLDLVVGNDTVRNFLFINQQDGRFIESGIQHGLAFDTGGLATGAMGIDAAHFTNDQGLAIAIGNFANEMSSFYVSQPPDSFFSDDAIVAGIGADSRRALTFGLVFVDVDLDGRLDLITANGHVEPEINRVQSSQHYAQPVQLFWNCGSDCARRYQLVNQIAGDLIAPLVGRGAAYADVDGDGDQDLLITQSGGRPVLLRNDQALGHRWLKLRLQSRPPNINAIGASVKVVASGSSQRQNVMPTRSYLSQVGLPITFGLGDARQVDEVIVQWPDGKTETWLDLDVDRAYLLQQDTGQKTLH